MLNRSVFLWYLNSKPQNRVVLDPFTRKAVNNSSLFLRYFSSKKVAAYSHYTYPLFCAHYLMKRAQYTLFNFVCPVSFTNYGFVVGKIYRAYKDKYVLILTNYTSIFYFETQTHENNNFNTLTTQHCNKNRNHLL